jgi:hypothetical protein
MTRRPHPFWMKALRWTPLLAGGLMLQNLTGCDPDVRNAVLTGIQTSLTTLISSILNAFFLSLADIGGSTSQPIVQATFKTLSGWLA